MKFILPKLQYPYDALEPYIDARTMEIHHAKHHQAYVDKLNATLEKYEKLQEKSLEELLENLDALPAEIRMAVRNHGGGHYNHSLFWNIMAPPSGKTAESKGGGELTGKLAEAIEKSFGSFSNFREEFAKAALGIFGSGWAWVAINEKLKIENGKLAIITTPNQDTPLATGHAPILGLDVWEHAYYLKYENRRPEYVEAWWRVVNWQEVENRYLSKTQYLRA